MTQGKVKVQCLSGFQAEIQHFHIWQSCSIFGKQETAEIVKMTHQRIKIKRYEPSNQPILMQLSCNNGNNWQQTCFTRVNWT